MVALAYVERIVSYASFPLHGRTWKRLALTAWLLASKMWDDECLESLEFARLFGMGKAAFYAQRQWQQRDAKQKLQLF